MKPPRRTVGKAGTKGTKPLPDGAGIAVRPFPVQLFTVRPFPKKAVTSPESFHDLGEILTPAQMAAKATPLAIAEANGEPPDKVPASVSPRYIAKATGKAIAALVGSGPKQDEPHLDTALALAEGLARLRDHALAGDADAFARLGFILRNAVADFHEIAQRHPAIAAAWGKTQNTLPALVGRNPGHLSDLEKTFTRFNLGEASPYRVNSEPRKGGRAPNASNSTNTLAAGLCEHLNAHRPPAFLVRYCRPPVPDWVKLASTLHELSRETADQWADAAIKLLVSSFENDGELVRYCSLGDVREDETRKGVSPQISAINTRVRRAIHKIAKKVL
jgi:hypothetical protein